MKQRKHSNQEVVAAIVARSVDSVCVNPPVLEPPLSASPPPATSQLIRADSNGLLTSGKEKEDNGPHPQRLLRLLDETREQLNALRAALDVERRDRQTLREALDAERRERQAETWALRGQLSRLTGVRPINTGTYERFHSASLQWPLSGWRVDLLSGQPGARGFADGLLHTAQFNNPGALCVLDADHLLVADAANHCLRELDLRAGQVSTRVGRPQQAGYRNGTAAEALLSGPISLALDSNGHVLVADYHNCCVRKVERSADGLWLEVTTVAGRRHAVDLNDDDCRDGVGQLARFCSVDSITVDTNSGVAYVADRLCIRRVVFAGGYVSTLRRRAAAAPHERYHFAASEEPQLRAVALSVCISLDGQQLYWSDFSSLHVLDVRSGAVRLVAGDEQAQGFVDGTAQVARFNWPFALCFSADRSSLIICDDNKSVRHCSVADGRVKTLASRTAPCVAAMAQPAHFDHPVDVCVCPGDEFSLVVSDNGSSCIWRVWLDGLSRRARTAFLLGLHSRAGANSPIRRSLVTRGHALFDSHLLRAIFSCV